MIDACIEDPRWRDALDDPVGLARSSALACLGGGEYEISVVFSSDKHVKSLNAKYRKKDKATNVLSFNYSNGIPGSEFVVGEVVLAFETVLAESKEIGFLHHTRHLLVHGTLHILGYDHQTDEEFAQMEKKEQEILSALLLKEGMSNS